MALRAPCITIRTPLEINHLKSSRLAAGKEKDLKKKGSRNPATGGDASLSMQYEFNGMASQGVLQGTVYEEYLPFDDAPAYAAGELLTAANPFELESYLYSNIGYQQPHWRNS